MTLPRDPVPGAPPLDPSAPVPDDPGELDDPGALPPAPAEPAPDVVPVAPPDREPEPV